MEENYQSALWVNWFDWLSWLVFAVGFLPHCINPINKSVECSPDDTLVVLDRTCSLVAGSVWDLKTSGSLWDVLFQLYYVCL